MDFLNTNGKPKERNKEFTGVAYTATTTLSPEMEIKHQSKLQNEYLEQLLASKWYQIGKRNTLIKRINSCEKRIKALINIMSKL